MRHLVLFIIIFSFHSSNSQKIYVSGKITDVNNTPVPHAHIYSKNARSTGSISNNDGLFYLVVNKLRDTLVVSHVNYETKFIPIQHRVEKLEIELRSSERFLQEVTIKAISIEEIMKSVFKNLKDNHKVEPVTYNFFCRIINHLPDSSLVTIEEHAGQIYQNRLHMSSFHLEKTRIKAFSKEGKNMLKTYRMIKFVEIFSDNIFKYLEDYLHPRKSKIYKLELEDELIFNERPVYKISFHTDKHTYYKSGHLLIDKKTFGVAQKVTKNSSDIKTINFVMVGPKWYLANSTFYMKREAQNTDKITLYEFDPEILGDVDKKDFIYAGQFVRGKVKDYSGSFDDQYWDNYSHIPIPLWVVKKMEVNSPEKRKLDVLRNPRNP